MHFCNIIAKLTGLYSSRNEGACLGIKKKRVNIFCPGNYNRIKQIYRFALMSLFQSLLSQNTLKVIFF